jgi:hypothetical protein
MSGDIELIEENRDQKLTVNETEASTSTSMHLLEAGMGLDYEFILKTLKEHNRLDLLPPLYQDHLETIQQVRGSPLKSLLGGMVGCGSGLLLFAMGGILASQFTALNPIQRYLLASSPLLLGGLLRIGLAAVESDHGMGKEGICSLLAISIIGVSGIAILLSTTDDLSKITIHDWQFWAFLLFNILSGKGVAAYSPGMTLAAKSAPDDALSNQRKVLFEALSKELNTIIQPGVIDRTFSNVLRKGPAIYMTLVAGVSNLAPGLMLLFARRLLMPAIGLRDTYLVAALATLAGLAGTLYLTTNAVVDQLLAIDPKLSPEKANALAAGMGQKIFSSSTNFLDTIRQLTPSQVRQIALATLHYTTTFGVLTAITTTGSLTLTSRGMSPDEASSTIAFISMISSATRGLLSIYSFSLTLETIANASFVYMTLSSIMFALTKNPRIWTSMLYSFSVANGAGIFFVISQIGKKIPEKVGETMGISSGIAAFSAVPVSLAFAWISSFNHTTEVTSDHVKRTDTALQYLIAAGLCATSLAVNTTPSVIKAISRFGAFAVNRESNNTRPSEPEHGSICARV